MGSKSTYRITLSKCMKSNETLANVISKGVCNLANVYVLCTGLCTTLMAL